MQKLAIITSQQDLDWISCKSISANLLECYKHALNNEYRVFSIKSKDSKYTTRRVASEIKNWCADKLIFIDHNPSPADFISILRDVGPDYQPNLTIHVYGDFLIKVADWVTAEHALAGFSIHWICASEKQANLLKKFVSEENSKIDVCPFPVSEKDYYFDETARVNFRKELNIANDESVFIYTGRLSLQKNILALIRAFDFYQRNVNTRAMLLMAGPIDDIGMPYLGKTSPPGLMAYDIQSLTNTLFSSERKRQIQYLGNLNTKMLNSLYCTADLYISLSTHNDEDYGMAPAEALLTGCPCVLTDWGGYSGFKNIFEDYVKFIPTQIGTKNITFDQKQIISALMSSININSVESRKQTAILAIKNHSIKSCIEKIRSLINYDHSLKFKKFSPLFHQAEITFSVNPNSPFGNAQAFTSLYKDIYNVYPS